MMSPPSGPWSAMVALQAVLAVALVGGASAATRSCAVSRPTPKQCSAASTPSCPSDIVLAMLPDSDGNMCESIWGTPMKINLPFFSTFHERLADQISQNLAKVYGSDASGHHDLCEHLIGLRESEQYCLVTGGPLSGSSHKVGSLVLNRVMTGSACVAFQPDYGTVSFAFGSGFGFGFMNTRIALMGVMVSQQGCAEVTLDTVLDLTSMRAVQPSSPFKAHAGAKIVLEWELDLGKWIKLTVTTSLAAHLNLDYSGDGALVSPSDVLQSMVQTSCVPGSYNTKDFATLMQAKMIGTLTIGEILRVKPAEANMQLLLSSTSSETNFDFSASISSPRRLSDFIESLMPVISMTMIEDWFCEALEISKSRNPFCPEFVGWRQKISLHFKIRSKGSSTTVGLLGLVGSYSFSLKKDSEGWEMCAGGTCKRGCFVDAECGPQNGIKHTCSNSAGRFQCEPVWGACCSTGTPPYGGGFFHTTCSPSRRRSNGVCGGCLLTKNSFTSEQGCVDQTGWVSSQYVDWFLAVNAKYCKENTQAVQDGLITAAEQLVSCIKRPAPAPAPGTSSSDVFCKNVFKAADLRAETLPAPGEFFNPSPSPSPSPSPYNGLCPGGDDTGGTCSLYACANYRGGTNCVAGKCVCRQGYCLQNGETCVQVRNPDTQEVKAAGAEGLSVGVLALVAVLVGGCLLACCCYCARRPSPQPAQDLNGLSDVSGPSQPRPVDEESPSRLGGADIPEARPGLDLPRPDDEEVPEAAPEEIIIEDETLNHASPEDNEVIEPPPADPAQPEEIIIEVEENVPEATNVVEEIAV